MRKILILFSIFLFSIAYADEEEKDILLLANLYLKENQIEKIYKLADYVNKKNFSEETKYLVFEKATFLLAKNYNRNLLRQLISKIESNKENQIFPISFPKVYINNVELELGKNIFYLNDKIFGNLYIYIVKNERTLQEIALKTSTGYYELKYANPDIDPLNLKENQVIIIPLKKILPDYCRYGEICVNIPEFRLYYVIDDYVITFPVGIGDEKAQTPIGEFIITEKVKNPDWIVPPSVKKENPNYPDIIPASPDNPIGTRKMRLNDTSYMIHGTNKPEGVGMKVSYGCIVLRNEDLEKLFDLVDIKTKVIIKDTPVKVYKSMNLFESYPSVYKYQNKTSFVSSFPMRLIP
ncbi:hypothetical protein JCM14244_12700 [Venenivibrio stagnispumantis]|uniref:Lipoprotein-anchoring transpeptidase ErfK/SrfK n=1 Tax=Venenivibrio stagnispumantis TaxID=407998 RepID=A0AA45WMK8_9AQUI|nr:L,D-transpeptidase family protein [Venenivibrio stagnispumantis]MCW4573784.1 L,D-transpeptidase family protein [Venenivibrio stagnispumantis]SMP14755.1 Lipoprotein-anchoring transpeptidase ErfK/SrfK [Venenivibrio stagnispumantis]